MSPKGKSLAPQFDVAKNSAPTTLTFKPGRRRKSLIEWSDSSRQAQALDWHHRAQEFGLDVESHEDVEGGPRYDADPKRLLEDEEPEAFAPQHLDDAEFEREQDEDEEEEERFEAGSTGREDVDLVRVY